MPYIGNTAANRFVAPKAASVFSGDGSTTAFTLDHAVGSDEDILVSVDGVIQEPSVAYAVSNGTTLTFTAAPSSNSGNNIFVYYLFRTVGTVSHPSNNALQATSGTFTGDLTVDTDTLKVDSTNNRVGIGTTSPTQLLQVESSTNSEEVQVRLRGLTSSGGGRSAVIGFDPSSTTAAENHTFIGDGSSKFLKVDNAGHVTKPLQPAFLATPSSSQTNMATDSNVTVVFATEVFDQNSDFSSNTFTAPVTGRYQLSFHVRITTMDKDASYTALRLNTSNRTCDTIVDSNEFGSDVDYVSYSVSLLMDMDANDTASIIFYQGGGAAQVDTDPNHSYFSGYLVA
jgi:hypothetical protein